jgi:hypothetical protein
LGSFTFFSRLRFPLPFSSSSESPDAAFLTSVGLPGLALMAAADLLLGFDFFSSAVLSPPSASSTSPAPAPEVDLSSASL